jgi:UDP-N-acetylmuramate--alanine ligase
VPFYGFAVVCLDHPEVQALAATVENRRLITYGANPQAEVRATNISMGPDGARFDVEIAIRGEVPAVIADLRLPMAGMHNVLNACAAIAVAHELGVSDEDLKKGLAGFGGVKRRFTTTGVARGVRIVDDYGHHPVEIRATLAAAKAGFDSRVVTVFQPHRYSRTHHLCQEFLTAFNQADVLIVMDIYPAGEPPIPGVSAEDLAEGIRAHGHRNVTFLGSDRARIVEYVCEISRPGDLVLTLGAGDVSQLGPDILRRLEAESPDGG